jgi:aspartate aminotransferase-like enzyme
LRHLLDIPAYPASGYARLADRIVALLDTRNDVLLVQGEAIVALEAVAASLAGPQIHAVNVVTSPYGQWFGEWLRRGGADVFDVTAEPGLPIEAEAVEKAFRSRPETNVVALAHAESASGILNPLPEIAGLVRSRDALLIVDCVASVGGHELGVDALGIDVAVIGPQKALGGPAGVSAMSVSSGAWRLIDRPGALRLSSLSLPDLRRHWLEAGRGSLPGMPSALEFHALEAALDRVESEGIDALVARHALAAAATRDGLRALGLAPWVADAQASNLVTAFRPPQAIGFGHFLATAAGIEAEITAGVGEAGQGLVRLNHTGQRASREAAVGNIRAVAAAMREAGDTPDDGGQAAIEAVARRYRDRP